MSIKEQAAKSVFWSAAERFSVQGIQFVLTLVIARILSPDAYGLVAMLGIFMALSQVLVDSGFAKLLFKRKTVRKPITVLLSISMPQVRC